MKTPARPREKAKRSAPPGELRLGITEALASPCASCATSPCCTYLPLHTFRVTTLLELDHARYLLNFDHIELGLAASGDWTAYYRFPCRFLDRGDFRCTVHNTPEQPNICVHYNPYNCWYRPALNEQVPAQFVRVDRRRFEWLMERVVFDEQRTIVEVAPWDAMVEAFAGLAPMALGTFGAEPMDDPVMAQWQNVVLDVTRHRQAATEHQDASPEAPDTPAAAGASPCTGCPAPCCSTVVFPLPAPVSAANLDFIRFSLGFPGIEIGVSDTRGWTIAVKSTCRHFADGRCSAYGTSERPLLCTYYDEYACAYRREFLPARPEHRVRVRLEEFPMLASTFRFDADQQTVEIPTAAAVREAIETRWLSSVGAADLTDA